MEKKILDITDLHLDFKIGNRKVEALCGVSVNLKEKEMVGLVGESGSGKSLLVKSALRLLPENASISNGSVRLNERELCTLTEKEMRTVRGKEAAMIFQDPMTGLNPLRTVGYHLEEVLSRFRNLKGKQAKVQAEEALKQVGMTDPHLRLKQYPHELSGGMRQRVMIAMALCADSPVIIADEPTTALDVTIQAQILDLLVALKEEHNKSILLITHDLAVVAERCDRVYVMYGGLILEEGTVHEIFNQPANPYTQALMGAIPKEGQNREKRLATIPKSAPSIFELGNHCPFSERCAQAQQICREQQPPCVRLTDTHQSHCHLEMGGTRK